MSHDEPADRRAETPPHALHGMNPCGRFSDRVRDYVRYRPDYPAAAFDHMLAGLATGPGCVVADVGAGTGIATRALAARGVRVLAVEPNAEMRAAAEPHPLVEWRDGSAEHTGLPDASVQLVLCAQAFHWFRAPEALAEFQRVLAPGGRLALLWNTRSADDAFTAGYTAAIRAVSGDHAAEMRPFDAGVVSAEGRFEPAALARFDHAQRTDLTGLVGRATSASYVPKQGEPFERLQGLLAALHERHRDADGFVTLRYVTELWCARRCEPGERA